MATSDLEDGIKKSSDLEDEIKETSDLEDGMMVTGDLEDEIKETSDLEDEIKETSDLEDGIKETSDLEDGIMATSDLEDGTMATSDWEDGIMATNDLEDGIIEMSEVSIRLLDRVVNEYTGAGKPPTIYMAPSVLRDVSPSSFNPRLVSIGPLHKEDENVQAFQMQKANYLIELIYLVDAPIEETLQSCVEKAYASMTDIKACYVWTRTYRDDEIAEMMVMDACFILGFILKMVRLSIEQQLSGRGMLLISVIHDLVLLENQIPLFFLNEILKCTVSKFAPNLSLITLIEPILSFNNLFDADIETENISINESHHILSLLHQCYGSRVEINTKIRGDLFSSSNSVVNLDRAGVNFKPNQNSTWVMGMKVELSRFSSFCGSWIKPTLRMPILNVSDSTEMILRNLIAYERTFETRNFVASYAFAMDMLVNTEEDVAKLVESRVLVNVMGSNKEAADMINNICKNVSHEEFYYNESWEILNKYCNSYWPKHIAWMRGTYFNSPWSMIALLAGIMLFALTVTQTIFTIIK